MERSPPPTPIADYGLIGNRHTCALVSRGGSIDWCCLPHLESPSVFAAILDDARGGRWSIAPVDQATATREYLGCSPVLDTVFRSGTGVLRLRDFIPIRGGREGETSRSAHGIVRIAECLEGEVPLDIEWMPRPNYARDDVEITRDGDALVARSRQGSFWISGLPESERVRLHGAAVSSRATLRAGERLPLVSGWGDPAGESAGLLARRYLDETLEWWSRWERECGVEPIVDRWRPQVLRSGMVLQLLTNERTGAMAAAPTTSLPEEIGGVRNWDYRFCWVRDASMISRAFITLGQRRDGIAFLRFLENAARQHRDPARVQVLYGLNGETWLPEYTLGHLDGYAESRPVRIGNDAMLQRQLDAYGELIQAAHDLLEIGAAPNDAQSEWLCRIADYVCDVWRLPDHGIWEVRGPERHFTYSKLMCWVALDRALRIATRMDWTCDTARWLRERQEIRRVILDEGYDPARRTFVQSFGDGALDASTLLIPLFGFLPPSDPRVQGTIDAVLRWLTRDGLVYRYVTDESADGVSGGEGAFALCAFWLVDALALSGRVEEALPLFERMLDRANDVGLYSEEIDPATGEFLGNFPQAFSHVGVINSAHYLGRALMARERGEAAGAAPAGWPTTAAAR